MKVSKILQGAGIAVGVLVFLVVLLAVFTPYITRYYAKIAWGNYPSSVEQSTSVLDGDVTKIGNVAYSTEYVNSYMDVYIPAGNNPNPVVIWIHGGGFTADDKETITPAAERFAQNGYTVFNINYALVPDAVYPDPLLQINEAYRYIAANAEKYQADMSRVFFGGDSAGGQLAGQYVNFQVNAEYAQSLAISMEPVVPAESIRGILFYCAFLNMQDINSGDVFLDYLFGNFVWDYFQDRQWKTSATVQQASIVGNIGAYYPPAFITDGNTGSFTNQAIQLASELQDHGLVYELNLYDRAQAVLPHEYQFNSAYPQAEDNWVKVLEFMRQYI